MWEPRHNHVDYAFNLLNSLGLMWSDDPFLNESMRLHAMTKLNELWAVVWQSMPEGHQPVCAQVFWDRLAAMLPSWGVYKILATFGEAVNPSNDARRVDIVFQPKGWVESVLLTCSVLACHKWR